MIHRFRSMSLWPLSALCVLGAANGIAGTARAQNLAFTPGLASAYAGDPTQSKAQSSAGYTGPLSGLVLGSPSSVAFDGNGNLYIVDRFYLAGTYAVVRVVASGKGAIPAVPAAGSSPAAGTVYPVAGNSTGSIVAPCTYPGTATDQYGDGCAATDAYLSEQGGGAPVLGSDANGNIYLSDPTADLIRVIYAGGSIPGLPSNPVPGNIYAIAGSGAAGTNGDGGPALSAQLSTPASVSLDSHGNIYISDAFNDAVRVVYVGGSVPGLPSSPTVGNLYTIAGTLGQTCSFGSTTCGDDGPATAAQFNYNMGPVALDPFGNIYIADTYNARVRAIYVAGALPGISSPTVGNIYTVAGGGTSTTSGQATKFQLQTPAYMAFDSGGALYFTDGQAKLAYKVESTGILTPVFGGGTGCGAHTDAYGDGCATNAATLNFPDGITIDSAGNLYVADGNLIRKATVSSTTLTFTGTYGLTGPSQVLTVSNTGTQPLQLSNLSVEAPFAQVATGGSTDCGSSTSIEPGASCQIGISVTPTQAGIATGTLQVSSDAKNATGGQNTANLSASIAQAASSIVLAASPAVPAQAGPGQPVTFTATVTPETGVSSVPTGTVNFNNGATPLGSATLNSSGVATFTTSSLAAASYVVTAVYAGDTNFSAGNSNAAFVTVASAAVPTVTLTASPTSVTAGQAVTLTATITPPSGGATPTGSIVFQNGVAPISTAIPLSGGSATFSTTTLPAGPNTLIAVYSGNLPANDSNGVVVTVGANAQLSFTPGVISAIAGDYQGGYKGDGGAATSAELFSPQGGAYDSAGNLYFADGSNNVVRVVASGKGTIPGVASPVAGDIYTVAGVQGKTCSSSSLPCGDGGQATNAYLNFGYNGVAGVAVDLAGNLYIADSSDAAIRKVTPAGTISTVAGTLASGATSSGDGGPATQAQLTSTIPAIAVDNAGNLYIMDSSLVRKVDAQTHIITTIAGSLTATGFSGDGGPANAAGLSLPASIALDGQGNLYISDTNNQVVRMVSAQTGIISTVAGYYYPDPLASTGCNFNYNDHCFAGDGGPATKASLLTPSGISVDAAGNLYIVDAGNYAVRMVDAQTGIINTIAGQGAQYCSVAPCGDGGLATSATFGGPTGLTLDSAGDLTISDSFMGAVRQVTAGTTTLNFDIPTPGTTLGTIVDKSVAVTNTGSQPLTLSAIVASSGFTQAASGGTDCTATTTLAPAEQCTIDVEFFPTAAQAYTGTLTVASNSTNAQSGNNTISLSGTAVANSGSTPQTISFPAPSGPFYWGTKVALNATTTAPGLNIEYLVTSGPATVLNNNTANASLQITGAGSITVTAYQFGDNNFAAAAPVSVTITAVQPVLTVAANPVSIALGQPIPAFTASSYTAGPFVNGDTASVLTGSPAFTVTDSSGKTYAPGSTPPCGNYTIALAQGTLTAPAYYKLTFVSAALTITGTQPQTITGLTPPANLTYGAAPIVLAATASSGLPVTYTASSNPAGIASVTGSILTINGAGVVSVTANQAGSCTYAAATPLSASIQVAKAPLKVSAANLTQAQGVAIPALISASDYTFSGFVNQETSSVLSGLPSLTVTDSNGNVQPVGSTPPTGTYTIAASQGTLSSPNYAFTFVNGTLTINTGQSQTITFPALPNVTYGAAPITLGASVSSGLGITYAVTSGPATVAGNMLSIQGAGTITVQASQPGNTTYAPASATQSFSVGPALLTVTAANATRVNDTPNPPLTDYTITGFVNGDTQAVVNGVPALSTPAQPGSPVGTYPIVITQLPANSAQNPMSALNYTFAFVNGVLTITPGGPTPDFSLTASPAVLGIPQGQLRQTTITLVPTNYYQGVIKPSCGHLPANMTCVFSPSALNADGTGNPVSVTLTVNTNAASPVVAQTSLPFGTGPGVSLAVTFSLPAELAALVVVLYRRKQAKNTRALQLLILLILLTGSAALTACGGGSSSGSSSPYTAPGSYTVSLSAADSASGVSHSVNLVIDVQ